MKNTILISFLILVSYQCNSQSLETTLYLKEELIRQQTNNNSSSKTKYLTKSINYDTNYFNALNSTTTKKKRSKPRTTRRYIRGSRGGCYYINANGNKTYVDRSMCN